MYYLYKIKDNNQIFSNGVLVPDPDLINLEYMGTSETPVKQGLYDLVDGKLVQSDPGYQHHRRFAYEKLGQQLDKLWHDIDAGLFGALAKTGEFYTSIQAVKQEFPKI